MKVGVLGAGSMGIGIAQIAATFGHQVILCDNSAAAIQKSMDKLVNVFDRLIKKGRMTEDGKSDILGRIQTTSMVSEFNDCQIVIEAIIENIDVKKSVFQKIEEVVLDDCILATNTSSLSVSSIAAACTKPERVIGIHFFNPAPLMKLVEIIPAIQTAEEVLNKARKLIDSWQKVTVLAKDTPGFIVNRVARPFYGESLRILEEGIADVPTIDWAMTALAGFRMGPFKLMDYIGNDVNYIVTETVFKAFYFDPRYKPSFTQKRLSEAGYYGRKSGLGYYNYADESSNPSAKEDQQLGQYIVDRVVVMLINEAVDALFWNVATENDIDLAMTKGVNYPKGLLQWGKEIGYDKCVQQLDDLYDEYHEDRYRCSPLLRKLAQNG
ncbi:MAG: 3-hydroxyacyl-CoA dehydrogenase NAD-binding domain-containing protein [Saprospiraceae bacterium]|nr:3-hydroxyacyl-CoA dehydrogenase NAD-binding domain-containing protein [Saprospiraceae bacterium]